MDRALSFHQLPLVNSVSTRLFRNVFLIYFVVIIFLTGLQMMSEYKHVQEEIFRELVAIETTVEPEPPKALSQGDGVKMSSVLASLSRLPIVEGITVEDEDGNAQATSTMALWNWKQAVDGTIGLTERLTEPYEGEQFFGHDFDIIDPTKRKQIGKGTIYVSDNIVWDRVKYGFQLIILNSILKTTALWVIFLLLSRLMLAKPLQKIVNVIRNINMDNLEPHAINLKRKHHDELKIIETALKEMVQNLAATQVEIRDKNRELEEKNKQLYKMDQLKDEFLANTSHELRTPLHGIIGIARSMKATFSEKQFKNLRLNLNVIINSGKHLSLLVDDILDFSKLRNKALSLKLKTVDVRQVVRIVEQLSKPLIVNKDIKIENKVPQDLLKVKADDARLQQVFRNLIGNAIKFSDQGVISVSGVERENFIEISVSDPASSIPPEKYEMIFQPFEQGDASISRKHGGAGLGLAIAKQLVELHGGKISIEPGKTTGNIFKFTLPVSRSSEGETPVVNKTIEPEKQMPLPIPSEDQLQVESLIQIVVVDDDPVNLQVVQNFLSPLQYSVVSFLSGKEALLWIEKHGKPDLVLLDIMMPEMNGFEVCRSLRQQYDVGTLPIIFLTASHRRKDVKTGFSIGANDYLTKPFEKPELILRIRLHLRLLFAKKQLQTLRDFANKISDFKDHAQLLNYFISSMLSTRLVSDAVMYEGEELSRPSEKGWTFLDVPLNWEDFAAEIGMAGQELVVLNSIDPGHPLTNGLKKREVDFPGGGHIALIQPNCCRDNLIVFYRSKERMPFSELDQEYIASWIDQLKTIEVNIKSMLSDQLVIALPEIQPYLPKITHITAASPYCSVHIENEKVAREVRISLSSLDFYFGDDSLLRSHRSYLINPKKVTEIKKRFVGNKKYRYELTLGNGAKDLQLRIGDSYVSKMKKVFPQYFD